MKPFRSHRVALRGLDAHVLTWGEPAAPKLFLLHGWMDVAASFQFLVDALRARALRDRAGPARLRQERVAAAGLLVRRLHRRPRGAAAGVRARRERSISPATASAATSSLHYAGVRPARVRRVISLDGFGMRAEELGRGAGEDREMARCACAIRRNSRPTRASTRSPTGCRRTIRGCRATRRCFSRAHWAEALPDGRVRLASDPRHRLPFPTVYRIEETYAVWRNIAAPTLWVAAADSNIPKWLDDHPEGEGAHRHVRRRPAPLRAHSARADW